MAKHNLEFEGVIYNAKSLGDKLNMSPSVIRTRLHKGWTIEQIANTPYKTRIHKYEKPPREELSEVIKNQKVKGASEIYGVSCFLVYTWLKYYDIRAPKREMDDYPPLTSIQTEILEGSLLGDGWVDHQKRGESRFLEKHSPKVEEYLTWKWECLKPYSRKISTVFECPVIKVNGKPKIDKISSKVPIVKFYTCLHPYFTRLRELWYPDGIKIVPIDLKLTPLMIAVWFMDDGSVVASKKDARIATDSFMPIEVDFLRDLLLNDYNIQTTRFKSANNWAIRVRAASYFDFFDIIHPHLIWECFKYKRGF